MSALPSAASTAPAADRGLHRAAPDDYFKSREVYRSDRGFILVDAFRFVQHSAPSGGPAFKSEEKKTLKSEHTTARYGCAAGPHKFYFLSHFHSDHYTGIQRTWHTDTIYCSRPTAALTQSELGVSSACLFPMDMNETYVFSMRTGACLACVPETPLHARVQDMLNCGTAVAEDRFAVRLIPANHCPGSNMFLFVSPLFGTVLHTGDFRFNGAQRQWREGIGAPGRRTYVSAAQIEQQAVRVQQPSSSSDGMAGVPPLPPYEQFIADDVALREVAERAALDVLFLDNTFCGPPYKFPTQWEVTQNVIEALRSLLCRTASRMAAAQVPSVPSAPLERQPKAVRCAVLIGCYTIGKERVALAIRDAFSRVPGPAATADGTSETASMPIYVSPRRYSMLTAMRFFPECFQPFCTPPRAPPTPHGASAAADASASAAVVAVEDTPVQLPVLLSSDKAQRLWDNARGCVDDGEAPPQPPAPTVQRSLAAEFSTQLSDAPSSASGDDGGDGNTTYLLSTFLVSMATVGYQSVAALTRDPTAALLELEDGARLDLTPYDTVLLVEPTGWCKRCSSRAISDKFTLLKVPYSEHCGFHEMLRFVEFVNPSRVVPTVSEENYKTHESLFVERAPRLRSRVSNVQPITRFFSAAVPLKPSIKRELDGVAQGSEVSEVPASIRPSSSNGLHSSSAVTACAAGQATRQREGAADGGSTARTLERLFQRARVETQSSGGRCCTTTATRAATQAALTEAERGGSGDDEDDEDCQVVRVVQSVVEISDDD